MKLKALIFDVDGTLADTEECHRDAFNQAFQAHAIDWNWSRPHYAHLLSVAGGKERMSAYLATLPLAESERAVLREKIPAVHATKTRIYTSRVAEGGMPLRDGVEPLLDECVRSGVRLAIASTTSAQNIDALLLGNLGPEGIAMFSVIGAGDCVSHKKPAPDIYQWVLRELRESAADCVAIEDSANGLQAAKAAGLFTIVTPSYWTRSEDFSAADLVLPGLGSASRPLNHHAAQMLGSSALGVQNIERQLQKKQEAQHGCS